MTVEKITEMMKDFLMGPFYELGSGIWNFLMSLVYGVVTTTPQDFSSPTWSYVSTQLYPWALGIGLVLLNFFFLIGFFKQTANIKENMTTEILVSLCVKVVMANVLMNVGLEIMQQLFYMAAGLSGQVFSQPPAYSTGEVTMGTWIFFHAFYGIVYVIVASVCGMTIFLAVYGRYIKLYFAIVTGPLAMPTLAGGMGIENTAHAWIKTFLSYTFELLAIAILMSIAGKMISGIDWGRLDGAVGFLFNGATSSLQSMFTMVILAGTVKGTDTLMRRMFAL